MDDQILEIKLTKKKEKYLVSRINTSVAKNVAQAIFGDEWQEKLTLDPKSRMFSESIIVLWGLAKLNLSSEQFRTTGYPFKGTSDGEVEVALTKLVNAQTRDNEKKY